MALLTVALVFCIYTVADCAKNEEFRIAAPSVIRLCNDFKDKPLFCLICKGFDFSCFVSTQPTLPPTQPTTSSTTTTTTTTTAATPSNNGGNDAAPPEE